jgi:putative colanic acid biosynthesis glycosyltransferase
MLEPLPCFRSGTEFRPDGRVMISIVTVVRDDLPGLRRSYGSLPSESDDSLIEWVVVDGASVDGTAEWLANVEDRRLRYRSAPDGGIFDAMNRGTSMASGEHVLFLNAGDELAYPGVLSDIAARLRPDTDLAYGDAIEVTPDGREQQRSSRDPSWIRRGMFTHHQAMLFSRARLLDCGGYRTRFRLSADYDLVARWMQEGARTQWLGLTVARFHLGGRSSIWRRAAIEEDSVIRREVLGLRRLEAGGLAFAHLTHLAVKRSVPRLAGRWRAARR